MKNLIIYNYLKLKIDEAKRDNEKSVFIDSKDPIIDQYYNECSIEEFSDCVRDINNMGYNAKIVNDKDVKVDL